MPLKRYTSYPTIIAAIFIALAFVGGMLFFLAYLILAGDWSGIFSSFSIVLGMFGLIFLLFLCLAIIVALSYLYGVVWRVRTWSAIALGDSRLLASAPDQPVQPAKALAEALLSPRLNDIVVCLMTTSYQ
jgi:hypothetical protein